MRKFGAMVLVVEVSSVVWRTRGLICFRNCAFTFGRALEHLHSLNNITIRHKVGFKLPFFAFMHVQHMRNGLFFFFALFNTQVCLIVFLFLHAMAT